MSPTKYSKLKAVKVELEEGIAWVIVNRPTKHNSMNPEMNLEIMNVLDAIEIDERAKALVLTGAGDSFSAGMDLKEFFRNAAQESSPERLIQIRRHFTTLACW